MTRSLSWKSTALAVLLLTFGLSACKKNVPALPPPTPPPVVVAPPAAPPAPVIPAPTVTLRADNQTITRGATVTLNWTSTNAATVDIQPGIGAVTPAAGGSRQVSPTSSVTYSVTASRPGSTPASDTVRITVNDPPPPPPAAPPRAPAAPPRAPEPSLTKQQQVDRNMLPISFDYDKSDIRDDQKARLQAETTFLKANIDIRLVVEGHADERGSEEYNLALGDRRANAVKEYFLSQGIAATRFFAVSYGEERPLCSAQTEDCYTMNRRAAFRINP